MSGNPTIRYRFDLPDGGVRTLDFFFDAVDFKMQEDPVGARPFWTELGFCRCTNCPLDAASVEHCPAASRMAPAVEQLEALASFDTVGVTVTESGRTVHVETSAQEAMSSVIGLIMATAGCPWTDHLRPMARFHLPFASEAETMYRSVSMYLLARELLGGAHLADFVPSSICIATSKSSIAICHVGWARRRVRTPRATRSHCWTPTPACCPILSTNRSSGGSRCLTRGNPRKFQRFNLP